MNSEHPIEVFFFNLICEMVQARAALTKQIAAKDQELAALREQLAAATAQTETPASA